MLTDESLGLIPALDPSAPYNIPPLRAVGVVY